MTQMVTITQVEKYGHDICHENNKCTSQFTPQNTKVKS